MRRAFIFLMILASSACRTTKPGGPSPAPADLDVDEQPVLRPFARAKNFVVEDSITFRVLQGLDSIVVPAGFVSDFASIPGRAQGLINKLGPHLCPAIVHDYLYWTQTCTRSQSDAIFLRMMEDMGVPWLTRRLMYWAVVLFGQKSWDENTRLRAQGMKKVIPPEARPREPFETWAEYRSYLSTLNGNRSGAPVISSGFCWYPKVKKANGGHS